MRTYRVTYPETPFGQGLVRVDVQASLMQFENNMLVFKNEAGVIVSAFQTWVRVDRLF